MKLDEKEVVRVLDHLAAHGIDARLNGGWGIDALLGGQTRDHKDIDLIVDIDLTTDIRRLFDRSSGWGLHKDAYPVQISYRRHDGLHITFDLVRFDASGAATQQLYPGDGWGNTFHFPREGLAGEGSLAGRKVRCLTPKLQVECHLGYEPDDGDHRDMRLLADRFGLDLPPPYGVGESPDIRVPKAPDSR